MQLKKRGMNTGISMRSRVGWVHNMMNRLGGEMVDARVLKSLGPKVHVSSSLTRGTERRAMLNGDSGNLLSCASG